jgi:hypothetical protein
VSFLVAEVGIIPPDAFDGGGGKIRAGVFVPIPRISGAGKEKKADRKQYGGKPA